MLRKAFARLRELYATRVYLPRLLEPELRKYVEFRFLRDNTVTIIIIGQNLSFSRQLLVELERLDCISSTGQLTRRVIHIDQEEHHYDRATVYLEKYYV